MDLFGRVIGRQHMFYVSTLPVAFWPMLWWSMLVSPTTSSPETDGFHNSRKPNEQGGHVSEHCDLMSCSMIVFAGVCV